MNRIVPLSKYAVLSAVCATFMLVVAAGEAEPIVPPRLAVRPSVSGNLTPLPELAAGIDNWIDSVTTAYGVQTGPLCDDQTFLRRVSLDLVGEIPSLEEVSAFAKNTSVNKRAEKVADLLKRPEYAERWSQFWLDTLMTSQGAGFVQIEERVLQQYLYQQLRGDKSFDGVARELLTATNGPASGYLTLHLSQTTLPKTVDHVARTFLGARIGCAQCHDHPFDKWTQQDFWGFASFFAYTSGNYNGVADMETRLTGEKYDPPSPEYLLAARYLDGTLVDVTQPLPPAPGTRGARPQPMMQGANGRQRQQHGLEGVTTGEKLRKALAELITERDDLRFDRSIANRVWGALLGRGLVHPIDDIKSKQNGPHDDVLDLVAADFYASGRDFKRLLTLITSTQAYQRSSEGPAVAPGPLAKNQRDRAVRYFARAEVRPMTPEMLAKALTRVTVDDDRYKGTQRSRTQALQSDSKSNSTGAQLYAMYLSQLKPRNYGAQMMDSPEQENSFQRALMMMNAEFIQRAAQDAANSMRTHAQDDLVTIFAMTLGRPPSEKENQAFEGLKLKREAILWVLLNSAEFSSIH